MWQVLEKIDIKVFYLINRGGQNAFFDFFMPIITNVDNFYILLGVSWILLVVKKNIKCRSVAIMIILLVSVSDWVSSSVLKPAFERPRPYRCLSNVHFHNKEWRITPELKKVIKRSSDYSMPSSHATNIFASALFLSYYFRKFWPAFYLIALLVGYSRIYLGVHFPFDVVCGCITGTLCGLGFIWINNNLIRYFEKKAVCQ